MKYRLIFSKEKIGKNNEKVFMNVICCIHAWHFKAYGERVHSQ